jgi:hypothetical protein
MILSKNYSLSLTTISLPTKELFVSKNDTQFLCYFLFAIHSVIFSSAFSTAILIATAANCDKVLANDEPLLAVAY